MKKLADYWERELARRQREKYARLQPETTPKSGEAKSATDIDALASKLLPPGFGHLPDWLLHQRLAGWH